MTESDSEELVGRIIDGRYEITSPLEQGGMGQIYLAEHRQLGRRVALKVLLNEHVGNDALRVRFEREAKALASLSHPNVVTITDYGVDGDLPFLVMELLEGETLHQRLGQGPLDPEEAVNILRQVLRAFSYAHGRGIIHRDLKPGNVFLQALPDGHFHAKLLDFGLVRFMGGDSKREPTLTRSGALLGTPGYMPPEQASGGGADARADIYAAGVVFFEMLAGHRPFVGEPADVMRMHMLCPVPSIADHRPDLLEVDAVDRVIWKAMAKDVGERYPSAEAMLTALDSLPLPKKAPGVGPRGGAKETSLGTMPTLAASGDRREAKRVAARQSATPTAASPVPGSKGSAAESAESPGREVRPAEDAERPSREVRPAEDAESPGPVGSAPEKAVVPAPSSPNEEGREARGRRGAAHPARNRAIIGGVGLLLLAALLLVLLGEDEGGERADASLPDGVVGEAEAGGASVTPLQEQTEGPREGASETTAEAARLPPGDPWDGDPLPIRLRRIKQALDRGRPVHETHDRWMIRYAREHRDDPRPHLLLARTYLGRGWRSDAIERYELAFTTDPRSRGDERMLADLVELASQSAIHHKAARALETIYGAEALPAVDEALARDDLRPRARRRLERLRQTLAES